MKPISRFVGTTILGGVLLLIPIVVLGFVLSKAFVVLRRGLKPLTALVPDALGSGPTMTAILTIVLLALACFLAGLVAQTLLAQKVVNGLEAAVLSKLPGYEYLKEAGTSVLRPQRIGGASGRARATRGRLADRGADRRRRRRLRRRVRPQLAKPDVGIGLSLSPPTVSVRPTCRSPTAIACLRRCGIGSGTLLGELAGRAPLA